MMEGVHLNQRKNYVLSQPVDEVDREDLAGFPRSPPCQLKDVAGPSVGNGKPVWAAGGKLGLGHDGDASFEGKSLAPSTASMVSLCTVEDESGLDVDMGQQSPDYPMVISPQQPTDHPVLTTAHQPGLSELDHSINFRRGNVVVGGDMDVLRFLNEQPDGGVICDDKVLHSENGFYNEGQQYAVLSGTSKGAFGEAAMCRDCTTQKTYMRKIIYDRVEEKEGLTQVTKGMPKNEVSVPLMFKGNPGIPRVYGVNRRDSCTEIYQEFAGMSLKSVCESAYGQRLRDPGFLMALAFQGFATLDKLHSKGVAHLDIKPENLCVDVQEKVWTLKVIDFGSSQTSEDLVTEGLTNEYLSPESCRNIIEVSIGSKGRAEGRLETKTDVWAMALSLLYCLYNYHVMIRVCTGDTMYRETDPQKLTEKRIQCLIEICKLTDADIEEKLICPSWPQYLRVLLINTLRVNPNERWSAKQAAEFIISVLKKAQEHKPQAPAATRGIVFRGPTPSRLVIRTQAIAPQTTAVGESVRGVQPKQCTSPAPSFPGSPLPDFDGLMTSEVTRKVPRSNKRRCDQVCPYPSPCPAGYGYKVLKK